MVVARVVGRRFGLTAIGLAMGVGSIVVAQASCGSGAKDSGGSGSGGNSGSTAGTSSNGAGSGGSATSGSGATAGSGSGGSAGSGSSTGSSSGSTGGSGSTSGAPSDASVAQMSWDWNGVVGSGQSLSVGTPPVTGEHASTSQPYDNVMLSLPEVTANEVEDASLPPPWDASIPGLRMVPLVEPVRPIGSGFPRPYPVNIWGETPHAAMSNEITLLAKTGGAADYVTVPTIVGESGQGIVALVKFQDAGTTGATGRAYAATLFEATHIAALAKAAGKTYGISVIVMTHGETDATNQDYGDDLVQLLSDYNTDLSSITGQTQKIPMYLSQQHAYPCFQGPPIGCSDTAPGGRPLVNQFQWQLGVMYPGQFVCTGPKYQYPVNPDNDGIHLSATGYQLLGEKTAEVYYQRAILGNNWQPLYPTSASRSGNVVTVDFNVPAPPLNWDMSLDAPLITEWVNGNGFELWSGSTNIGIQSVAISGNSVQITAASTLPTTGLMVGYALADQGAQMKAASKAVRWGRLRDSDPFMGSTTMMTNPNYAVSFQLPVP